VLAGLKSGGALIGPCPSLPAAALSMPRTNVGTSITVTCASARSRSGSAFRLTKIRGAGPVASIPVAILGNAQTAPRRRSTWSRADFEQAWVVFLANRIESDFQVWRDQRDWTAEKYRCFDRHQPMPQDWRASGLPWLEATFRTSNTVAAWGNYITRLPKAEQRTKYSRRPWRH
jgi:hypothetical protein